MRYYLDINLDFYFLYMWKQKILTFKWQYMKDHTPMNYGFPLMCKALGQSDKAFLLSMTLSIWWRIIGYF